MRVVYSGPFPAVEVPVLGAVFERDVPADVPDEIGASLIEQLDWSEPEPTPPPPAAAKKPAAKATGSEKS